MRNIRVGWMMVVLFTFELGWREGGLFIVSMAVFY